MMGAESEKTKRAEIVRKRADAANTVIEDLKRHGVPEEIAHDLLIGYTQAIEGYYMEEWGARKVMIAAGALPGSLNQYRDAKMDEIVMGPR
jgi:hypothetical protein